MKKDAFQSLRTLKYWHEVCKLRFGQESAPAKFIHENIEKFGEDTIVTAGEDKLFSHLSKMHEHELAGRSELHI